MQLGPRGRPTAVLAKIRRAGGAGGRGKGGEVTMNSPRVGLRPEAGREGRQRALSAAPGRRPRWRALRRGGSSVEKVSKLASSSGCQKRWSVPQLGNAADRALGSPRRPPMAPADGSGRVGRAASYGSRRGGGGTCARQEGRPPLM
jgi:hypothetical protein